MVVPGNFQIQHSCSCECSEGLALTVFLENKQSGFSHPESGLCILHYLSSKFLLWGTRAEMGAQARRLM